MKSIYKKYFSCQHFAHYMSERLDRSLTIREKFSFWLHYLMCFTCRRVNRQVNILDKTIKSCSSDQENPNLCASDKCKARIKDLYNSHKD